LGDDTANLYALTVVVWELAARERPAHLGDLGVVRGGHEAAQRLARAARDGELFQHLDVAAHLEVENNA